MKLPRIDLPMLRWFRAFARARDGLAAIEFAMLAPIMLLIYFGLTEFTQAYMANRRANHMASIVADLIAQGETTNTAELQRAFDMGPLVLKPFKADDLSIRVTSVTWMNGKGAVVDWSRSSNNGLNNFKKNDVITVPEKLISNGESLIIGESRYVYEVEIARVIAQPLTFQRRYYLKPRSTDKITCSDCK